MTTKKLRLLDLFCGAGGAAMGYHRAGFEVVGVDIKPQPHYPFEFHQADALTYPLEGFDAYHASPPCQHYTMMQNIRKSSERHPDLIDAIRIRLEQTGCPYVIENVYKAPLRGHLMLCGTMFGLKIIRHRFFECPWMPMTLLPPCNHKDVYDPYHGNTNSQKFREAMGIDWMPDVGGGHRVGTVAEAIPPAYTEYIGKYLMKAIKELNG
jgi:hypothetical protein